MSEGEIKMAGLKCEMFIRRAFNCERRQKGADELFFLELIRSENHPKRYTGSYGARLAKAKIYLGNAVAKTRKFKVSREEDEDLQDLQQKIHYTDYISSCIPGIDRALQVCKRFTLG